jgi:hypothetical protein
VESRGDKRHESKRGVIREVKGEEMEGEEDKKG